jgi:hypothetical protein
VVVSAVSISIPEFLPELRDPARNAIGESLRPLPSFLRLPGISAFFRFTDVIDSASADLFNMDEAQPGAWEHFVSSPALADLLSVKQKQRFRTAPDDVLGRDSFWAIFIVKQLKGSNR